MKNTILLFGCGIVGLVAGFGMSALTTQAQLDTAAESAKTLNLSPTAAPAQPLHNAGGGSCG